MSLVNNRKFLDGLDQIQELVIMDFYVIQPTVYQAQKPHLLFAVFLALLKREEGDELRRESVLFPFPALMNARC